MSPDEARDSQEGSAGGAFPASQVKGVIGRGRRGAPGRGEGRKVGGPEGKGMDKDWIKPEGGMEPSPSIGLCNSSVIKVFIGFSQGGTLS